jgi:hypothetical protein
MDKKKTGCKGYYLDKKGKCEVIDWTPRRPTLKDCKRCTCPNNQYRKD